MALRLSIAAMRGTRAAAAVRRPFCSSSSSISIESSDKKTIADYDWVRVADRIDSVAQRVERIDQQLQELLLSQQPPRLHKGDKLYSISDQDQFEYSDAFCNINYIPPKYHDPGLPKFYKAAQRAIDSFNQSKMMLKMRGILKSAEQKMATPHGPVLPAHSVDRVMLPSLNQYVPRTTDWRLMGLGTTVQQQAGGSCSPDVVYRNLIDFGKLNQTFAYAPLEELRRCDFRSSWAPPSAHYNTFGGGAGNPEFHLQHVMRSGMIMDDSGVRVPLSGYIRLPPLNEDFLIRSIAQQPTIICMATGPNYAVYEEGIYEGEERKNINHAVNAIGYTEEFIIAEDSFFPTRGIDGRYLHIRRRGNDLFGVSGIHCLAFIPFMFDDLTQFNKFLLSCNLGYTMAKIGCFCDKDLKSVLKNTYFPPELMKAIQARCFRGYKPHFLETDDVGCDDSGFSSQDDE